MHIMFEAAPVPPALRRFHRRIGHRRIDCMTDWLYPSQNGVTHKLLNQIKNWQIRVVFIDKVVKLDT